ncbi:ester hydrolase C11orf54 homolog isoform X2 [Varroa jacobsoni]|nr:ester hydrolase C11orf54 homolog isoform X2 [Varroa destructor]XP_022658552.1 ester hydrolase C11orf54 homolog isoform X2 [Varroa destructor]XP_022658553.1 ester hydrolase C11orf54 homolog isoform X2 [Varroa destructor]XP_022658554.1 ester hydrolase C11orf54 homolog isoform X2 [Varroa destructor]XP_022658557.1 ester hydrolase C11orf54 homolog isoform X2 [Varroa destructor]XP_022691967.1 ester hydrolase C11orf54 homolog isoform X2 [Varroa jacobsoni]XP_022691968.1 ester hydrolase C11orf54 ho
MTMDIKIHDYYVPLLENVATALQRGLTESFAEVLVRVEDCPDLTKAPFYLAAEGLSGSARICDVGGVPYLIPVARPEKRYNYEEIALLAGVPDGFFVGAGAGPCHVIGTNSELMPNIKCGGNSGNLTKNKTYYARIREDGSHLVEKVPHGSADFSLMGNVFLSEGKPGKVLHLHLKKRTGPDNLTTSIRKILLKEFGPDRPVGLGGVFLITKGKAKLHIMPGFSKDPLTNNEDVEKWLHFFEFSAPLICLSVMSSYDSGWDLRIDHTHCFSTHGAGGHYHNDTTPEETEYDCWFNVAEKMVRIDQPKETHQIGRD